MDGAALTCESIAWLFMIESMAAKMFGAGEAFATTGVLTSMIFHVCSKGNRRKHLMKILSSWKARK